MLDTVYETKRGEIKESYYKVKAPLYFPHSQLESFVFNNCRNLTFSISPLVNTAKYLP